MIRKNSLGSANSLSLSFDSDLEEKEESSIKSAYNFYLNKKNNYNKKNDENKFFWLFQFCIII